MTDASIWRDVCRRKVVAGGQWPAESRREWQMWKRRLWWARQRTIRWILAVLVGALAGGAFFLIIDQLVRQ